MALVTMGDLSAPLPVPMPLFRPAGTSLARALRASMVRQQGIQVSTWPPSYSTWSAPLPYKTTFRPRPMTAQGLVPLSYNPPVKELVDATTSQPVPLAGSQAPETVIDGAGVVGPQQQADAQAQGAAMVVAQQLASKRKRIMLGGAAVLAIGAAFYFSKRRR